MDNLYDCDLDTSVETFEYLPEMVQEDLIAWFNVRNLDNEDDKILLLDLYQSGRFEAWDCPECNERVYEGNPDSYRDFQGVLNQDFSFFGNRDKYTEEYIEQMCDTCRCHSQNTKKGDKKKMKLWKIEKCEQHEKTCPCCEGVGLHVYHTEHQVLSLDERLGYAIMSCVEDEALANGNSLLVRITLVDNDAKVETGE